MRALPPPVLNLTCPFSSENYDICTGTTASRVAAAAFVGTIGGEISARIASGNVKEQLLM